MVAIENDWLPVPQAGSKKPYCTKLYHFIEDEYRTGAVYPAADRILEALMLTSLKEVRVVILGQDPCHESNQAHGLVSSVLSTQPVIPSSSKNIYRELHDEPGCHIPNNGHLKKWAEQGALLLNAVLTVCTHAASSHRNQGQEQFIDVILAAANQSEHRLVFLLWGCLAQEKLPMLDISRHLVLTPPYPSPLSTSRGFSGCRHFRKANESLQPIGEASTDWQTESTWHS